MRTDGPSPVGTGFGSGLVAGLLAPLRHRRLAAVLWLAGLVALLPALPSLLRFTARWDDGPFRDSILQGWDGWAVVSWFAFNPGEASTFSTAAALSVLLGAFLHLFLVPGVLRVLVADVRRPVLRRVVAESAALFGPNLLGFARYALTLLFWEGLLVALPAAAIGKVKGDEAPPNGPLDTIALVWILCAGTVVFLNVSVRWSMTRVALARGDSPTARGAFRVAKKRLKGARPSAIGIALFWLLAGTAIQVGFTNVALFLNPSTSKGIVGLVLFRQVGFLLLAASRVGYWASLLAFERHRRPLPAPAPRATLLGVFLLLLTAPLPVRAEVVSSPVFLGAVTATFDDSASTARVTVERLANAGCLVSGNLAVQLWASTAPVAVGQTPVGEKLLEVGLAPLLPGQYYPAWDSTSLAFTPPVAPAARDVVVVLAEQGADGVYRVRDTHDTGWRFFTSVALLSKGRVATTVRYRNPYGAEAMQGGVPQRAAHPRYVDDEFAFFWFSNSANAEVYVKALGDNDPGWFQLFAGGTTDFEYSVSWQGCGQVVSFTKPEFVTSGYVNGQGIDKTKCGTTCATIGAPTWRMSLSNSCGQQADWKFVQVIQTGCAFTFTVTGFAGMVVTGTLSGNTGAFTFAQSASCGGTGSGTLTVVDDKTVNATFSGSVPKTVPNCCPEGPLGGTFTLTR